MCSKSVPEGLQSLAGEQELGRKVAPISTHGAPGPDATDASGFMFPPGDDNEYFGTLPGPFDSFWDDDFFSMLTGNANIASNDILEGVRADTWTQS